MEIIVKTKKLPTKGMFYKFTEIRFASIPEVLPMEPQVLPTTKPFILPTPKEDDPFNVPAPLINPTPKGISFF